MDMCTLNEHAHAVYDTIQRPRTVHEYYMWTGCLYYLHSTTVIVWAPHVFVWHVQHQCTITMAPRTPDNRSLVVGALNRAGVCNYKCGYECEGSSYDKQVPSVRSVVWAWRACVCAWPCIVFSVVKPPTPPMLVYTYARPV